MICVSANIIGFMRTAPEHYGWLIVQYSIHKEPYISPYIVNELDQEHEHVPDMNVLHTELPKKLNVP